jgi:lysine-specific demethylase 3
MGVNSDGSIPCPPRGVGGRRDSVLELMSLLEENVISNLLEKPIQLSTMKECWRLEVQDFPALLTRSGEMSSGTSQKLASRENLSDNYIYYPNARHV